MMVAALEIQGLGRFFHQGDNEVRAVDGISLSVQPGEIVALTGRSGSGKSTLLQLAGLLDQADEGTILINGFNTTKADDNKRSALRRTDIGFVYQFHHLLPDFTALENVSLSARISGEGDVQAKRVAATMLDRMGLKDRMNHVPARLSGGEQQRVAIARALATGPVLLLADEPTGNLDDETTAQVFDLLRSIVQADGVAALIATHDMDLASQMDRTVHLVSGKLAHDT